MSQSKHRGDRGSALSSEPDLNVLAHTFDQVFEPGARLRDQSLTPSRDH
jgi:hypothetical protein